MDWDTGVKSFRETINFQRIACATTLSILLPAAALAAEYEARRFPDGSAWYVFDGPVEAAIDVATPDAPRCYDLGEIVLFFQSKEQLLDEDLVKQSALSAMSHYKALCNKLGQRGSSQRNVIGVPWDSPKPDDKGRFPIRDQLLAGYVTNLGRTDGGYSFIAQRNVALREKRNAGNREAMVKERRDAQQWLRGETSERSAD